MNSVDRFNVFEIGLWALFALSVALFGHRTNALSKTGRIVLTVALLAFAFSDFVELRTGAWWRPWWLLVIKGTCLGCFASVAWTAWSKTRRQSTPNSPYIFPYPEDPHRIDQPDLIAPETPEP